MPSVQLASGRAKTIEEWSVDHGAEGRVVIDATLQAGQHFIICLAASQMRSGLENATEYGN